MRSPIQLVTTKCLWLSVVIAANILMIVKSSSPSFKQVEYTNEFAIHVDASSRQEADTIANQIAHENGFINRGQVSQYTLLTVSGIYYFPCLPHNLMLCSLHLIHLLYNKREREREQLLCLHSLIDCN